MTEKRKIGISRIITVDDLIRTNAGDPISMARLRFVDALLELSRHPSFRWENGITVHISQVTEEEK